MRSAYFLGLLLLSRLVGQTVSTGDAALLDDANSAYRQLRSADAVRLYRQYLQLHPERADVRVFLGAALLNLNHLDEALVEAELAIKLDRRLAKAYVLEGRVHTEQQQWEEAMSCLQTAVALQPADTDAWYFAGRAAYGANRFGAAVDSFNRAIRISPEQSRLYEGVGLAYEALGEYNDAEGAYRKAISLSGSAYRPQFAMGRFLFKQGRAAESLPYFEAALRLSPSATEVRFELGRVLYQTGKTPDALRVLKEELPTKDCRVYPLLAKILREHGDSSAADKGLEEWRRCSAEAN